MSGPDRQPHALALLRAAKEQPDDDGPRLVLADWLETAGDASRAEFLRLQLALSPGSPVQLEGEARERAGERVADLLSRLGGDWLGPLWGHGGLWHRGLLSVELDRLRAPVGLDDMRPWIDSAVFEVPGRQALRWALALLAGLNHVTLALRRPFPAAVLLALFGAVPASACLRTLTVRWGPGMGRWMATGPFINLPEGFFVQLLKLPVGQHLTHLGSNFTFTDTQTSVLRAAGVEPVLARGPHWPHALPPAAFRR